MTPIGADSTVIVDPYNHTAKMNGEKNGFSPAVVSNGHTTKDEDTDSKKEEGKKEQPVVGMFEVVCSFAGVYLFIYSEFCSFRCRSQPFF